MRGAVARERQRWTNETELHSQMQEKLTLTLHMLDVRTDCSLIRVTSAYTAYLASHTTCMPAPRAVGNVGCGAA